MKDNLILTLTSLINNSQVLDRELKNEEVELNEIVQLVGKNSLSEDQKLTLDIADIIKG